MDKDWRILLLLCVLISSPVSLVIPAGNWISSEYSLVEEWSLKPLEYVSTVRVPIGCITESEEGSEYTWDITLLDENRVIKFEDHQQVDQIDIDMTVCQQFDIDFSPSGNYLLLFDDRDADCIRIDLDEMHAEHATLLDTHVPGSTYLSITDTGSIVLSTGLLRRIINARFANIFEYSGGRNYYEYFTHDNEGNRFFFTMVEQLIGVNGSGQEIWRTEIDSDYEIDDLVYGFSTDSFGRTVAVQRTSLLQLFNGNTGEPLYRESFERIVANPVFSPSGNFLAVETKTYDEMLNFTNGIRLYSINTLANEVTESCHSIYTNRESPRFIPISVSDNGMVLAQLSYWGAKRYRLVLLDSSGNAVWISALFSSESRYFTHSHGGYTGMTHDGSGIWHFDGRIVHAYRLERE